MPKSIILFISNRNYFLNFVSRLIQLFDFESLLKFYINLEIIISHIYFFVGLFIGKYEFFSFFLFLEASLSILIINLNDNLIV